MDLGLKGKTAIVTGGASNIGRSISITLAGEGVNVVIADIDEKQAEKVVGTVKASGGKAIAMKTDITDNNQVEAMVKKVLGQFKSIDILVNNVGKATKGFFAETTSEMRDKEIDVNYKGMLNCCRAVLPHMIERKAGVIVSTSSEGGRMGREGEAVYAGCKGAVIAVSKTIAKEVGRYGIRLNVVSPGMTRPDSPDEIGEYSMHSRTRDLEREAKVARTLPLGRIGKPQDIANAVAFLASDAASFITGQTLSVSGGDTMM